MVAGFRPSPKACDNAAMTVLVSLTAGLFIALMSALATGVVLRLLRRFAVLDHPNLRSSHTRPTPRGGGLAVVPVTAAAWVAIALSVAGADRALLSVAAPAAALAILFWFDDLRGLPIAVRLAAQMLAVAGLLAAFPADAPYFGGLLPPVVDVVAAGCLWLWFVNLYNFMDGIDGMAGTETAAIGGGVWLVALMAGLGQDVAFAGLAVAAAALGFLLWNWAPAKIFLGDVGSVPLGFMLGWLLLEVAARGQPEAALILPLYYLADATITLGRRVIRGERPWQAHRHHFYQLATASGMGHAAVVRHVLAADVMLIGLAALAAVGREAAALAGACLVVGILLMFLASPTGLRPQA